MMDSTIYAVVRIFLKHKDYESLFRILQHQDSYGIFPDLFSYNVLMDTFIEQKMFKGKIFVVSILVVHVFSYKNYFLIMLTCKIVYMKIDFLILNLCNL